MPACGLAVAPVVRAPGFHTSSLAFVKVCAPPRACAWPLSVGLRLVAGGSLLLTVICAWSDSAASCLIWELLSSRVPSDGLGAVFDRWLPDRSAELAPAAPAAGGAVTSPVACCATVDAAIPPPLSAAPPGAAPAASLSGGWVGEDHGAPTPAAICSLCLCIVSCVMCDHSGRSICWFISASCCSSGFPCILLIKSGRWWIFPGLWRISKLYSERRRYHLLSRLAAPPPVVSLLECSQQSAAWSVMITNLRPDVL